MENVACTAVVAVFSVVLIAAIVVGFNRVVVRRVVEYI